MEKRLLITGGSGFIGSTLCATPFRGWEIHATFRRHPLSIEGVRAHPLDIGAAEDVRRLFAEVRPEVVVHTAYDLDDLEGSVVRGTGNVAAASREVGSRLIHFSTDMVFGGGKSLYTEEDPPDPITPYGKTKASAEGFVDRARDLIVRTSLVYDPARTANHERFLLEGIREGREVRLFIDEYRSPVWVESIASAVRELVEMEAVNGVLHVAGAERISRYDYGLLLARARGFSTDLLVPASIRESPLPRPADCSLSIGKALRLLETPLPGVSRVLSASIPS